MTWWWRARPWRAAGPASGSCRLSIDIRLSARSVAAAMAGDIVSGDPARGFEGVSIDTRTLGAGELYIAVRGERFDGADFAGAALDAGAGGGVLPRGRGRSVGAFGTADRRLTPRSTVAPVVIEVDDTTVALQALAHQI